MVETRSIQELTDSLIQRMVAVRHWHDASFINLPMVYPSGSFVTVRLTQAAGGVKVSDAGFAYQEADMLGAGRAFVNTAKAVACHYDVQVGSRSIFVDVKPDEVERAIFDVSAASHLVAELIVSRAVEDDEATISDVLRTRLDHLFAKVVRNGDRRFPPEAYRYNDDVTPEAVAAIRARAAKQMGAADEWEVVDGFGLAQPA